MKRIFIGSSSEGYEKAEKIKQILDGIPQVKPVLWDQIFQPGLITYEALERESRNLAGVILLATPDDEAEVRGERVKIPRGNVMLEQGYFSAILGRQRTILCKYKEVKIPTDLDGVTYINMGDYPGHGSANLVIEPNTEAKVMSKIQDWTTGLTDVAEGIHHFDVIQGYSGIWTLSMHFTKWRGLDVMNEQGEYVECLGKIYLFFPLHAEIGQGLAQGRLAINVRSCQAEFEIVDTVDQATIETDGSLKITSRTYTRQLVEEIKGDPPQKDGFEQKLPGISSFKWVVSPSGKRKLEGEYKSYNGQEIRSQARVVLERF